MELFQGQETQIKARLGSKGRNSFKPSVTCLGHQKEKSFCQNLVQEDNILN